MPEAGANLKPSCINKDIVDNSNKAISKPGSAITKSLQITQPKTKVSEPISNNLYMQRNPESHIYEEIAPFKDKDKKPNSLDEEVTPDKALLDKNHIYDELIKPK